MRPVCRNVVPVDSQVCPCRPAAMTLSVQLVMPIYQAGFIPTPAIAATCERVDKHATRLTGYCLSLAGCRACYPARICYKKIPDASVMPVS